MFWVCFFGFVACCCRVSLLWVLLLLCFFLICLTSVSDCYSSCSSHVLELVVWNKTSYSCETCPNEKVKSCGKAAYTLVSKLSNFNDIDL